MRFDGHVVLVTGAAKGIGLRIGRAFGREGARVVDSAVLSIENPFVDITMTARYAGGVFVQLDALILYSGLRAQDRRRAGRNPG